MKCVYLNETLSLKSQALKNKTKPFLLQGSCGSLPVSEVVQATSCESDDFVNDRVLNLFKHQYLGLLPKETLKPKP